MANPAAAARANAQGIWSGATVAERLPNGIRHQHPTEPGRFMLDVQSGAKWHKADDSEIDSDWVSTGGAAQYQPYEWRVNNTDYELLFSPGNATLDTADILRYEHSSGLGVTLTLEALEYVNTVGGLQQIGTPANIGATPSGDTITYTAGYGAGYDLRLFADLSRIRKELRFSRAALPVSTIGTIEWVRLGVRFNVDNGVDIFIDGNEWGGGGSPDTSTTSHVEFRNTAGDVLWTFNHPIAINETTFEDAAGLVAWYRRQGPNLRLQIYVPYSWIEAQALTDVIMIDPTIDDQTGASGDDTQAQHGNSTHNTTTTSSKIGNHSNSNIQVRDSCSLFTNISGLSGATIDVSYTSWHFDSGDSNVLANLEAEDAASPSAPTSFSDFTGRTRTTANVAWDGQTSTGVQNSPSINTVIQELADSYDPTAILIFFVDDGTSTAGNPNYGVRTYDRAAGDAAQIHIEYTAAGAVTGFMTTNTGYWGP